MKVTLNWLKDFVNINVPVSELAEKLSLCGFEVEEVLEPGKGLEKVVVGKIVELKKHSNADKLHVCLLDIGKEQLQIVTGATNVAAGQFVPVALDGADLPCGTKIKNSVIRGEESFGMLCGGEELNVREDDYKGAGQDGILILNPEGLKAGMKISSVLARDDVVLDIKVLANRPDCQSVFGLAKEVAAILGTKVKEPDLSFTRSSETSSLKVEIKDRLNCTYYLGQVVKNIKLAPSAKEIQERLRLVGLKPINNIVDITNYVLWEIGQPMHAFDYSKVEGKKIQVRTAQLSERLEALNGKEYRLEKNMLIIADQSKPIGLAGITGGISSAINEQTTQIVLESAAFERACIRKTSRKLGLRSDSSARYEKGVEPVLCEMGLKRALHLIDKYKIGSICAAEASDKAVAIKERTISFKSDDVNKRLGIVIPEKDAVRILESLGLKTTIDCGTMQCVIPPVRSDLNTSDDLCEEIIRLYGYDKMPETLLGGAAITPGRYDSITAHKIKIRDLMSGVGAHEVITLPLISPAVIEKLLMKPSQVRPVVIENPLGQDYSQMRTQMAHSLLECIKLNFNRKNYDFAIYELSRVYSSEINADLPLEQAVLSYASCKTGETFFTVKAVLELLSKEYNLPFSYKKSNCPYLHPGVSADVFAGGRKIGHAGEVHPLVLSNYELETPIYIFEIFFEEIPRTGQKKLKALPKFPSAVRDLAIVVDEFTPAGEILSLIKGKAGEACESVELFDIYTGGQVGEGKKSLAFNIVFRSADSTLTEEQINSYMKTILTALNEKFSARLR